MKEIMISFRQPQVENILAGLQTQHRVPVSKKFMQTMRLAAEIGEISYFMDNGFLHENDAAYLVDFAKYQPGDIMVVRERARLTNASSDYLENGHGECRFKYEADGAVTDYILVPERLKPIKIGNCVPNGCFKELARIKRKVLRVWYERVKDISEADILAEGIRKVSKDGELYKYCIYDHGDYSSVPWSEMPRSPKPVFADLWDSIYPGSWERNDWVECIEFERKQK
jgi:hypothetical protein